jgi:hypothetical protein
MVTPRDERLKPVISMLCHDAAINNIIVDPSGNYCVTSCVKLILFK